MLLNEVYDRGPRLYPDKLAVIDGQRLFTYREFGDRHKRLANALLDLGLKRGDFLGALLKNCAELMEAHAAGAKIGVAVGGVNYRMAPDGIRDTIADLNCGVLLVDLEFAALVSRFRDDLPALHTCIVVGGDTAGMQEYEALLDRFSPVAPAIDVSPEDRAAIIYTTGTTGPPKGAVATRTVIMNRLCNSAIEMGFGPEDRFLQVLPMFHVGLNVAQSVIFRAGTLALLRDWNVATFCRTVQEYKINKTNLAPALLNFLLNSPESSQYDLSSIELMMYGAAPMPEAVMRKAKKVLPDCRFMQAYGGTEVHTAVFLHPHEHARALGGSVDSEWRKHSCGRAGALAITRVVNEQGLDVKPGEVGEILIGGGTVMTEYHNRPELTARALGNGWFRTNDLATVDEEGFIRIVDRKNFMIITGGENVYPAQVENVLFSHPKIAEVAVFGVPDDTWGEAVKAVVVLRPGESATEREIIDFCRDKMANYEKPKSVDFVSELPHGATGKVDKLRLRKLYLGEDS